MKKLLFITFVFLLLHLSVSAADPKIEVSFAKGEAGDKVLITVSVSNNPGIAAFLFDIDFDETKLTPVSITNGNALTVGSFNYSIAQGVKVMWHNTLNITDNGELFSIEFEITENTPNGEVPIILTYRSDDICNHFLENVDFTITGGIVEVVSSPQPDTGGNKPPNNSNNVTQEEVKGDEDNNLKEIVIEMIIDNPLVRINGENIVLDQPATILNGRTMLPIRFIAENLGAKVDWIEETQTVVITDETATIIIQIDNSVAQVNGKNIDLDQSATLLNGRTMLPIRFIAENLGAEVEWDEKMQTVKIVAFHYACNAIN